MGALLAAKLGRAFLDFDAEIERRQGMSISQIFGERGEPAFRELEREVTESVQAQDGMVLAPGGGWVAAPQTVALLKPPAKLVYLRVRPETALKRLGGAAGSRPLLNRPDPLGEMNRLLDERRTAYQSADFEIGTELLTPEQITNQIAAKVAES